MICVLILNSAIYSSRALLLVLFLFSFVHFNCCCVYETVIYWGIAKLQSSNQMRMKMNIKMEMRIIKALKVMRFNCGVSFFLSLPWRTIRNKNVWLKYFKSRFATISAFFTFFVCMRTWGLTSLSRMWHFGTIKFNWWLLVGSPIKLN